MGSRTPRNFDGILPTGKKIGDMLSDFLSQLLSKGAELPLDTVFQEWKNLLGERIAPLTEPVSFVEGVLTIIVKSSTLYSLLCQHEKPRLLRGLKKFQVRDLVFKIG